MAKKEEIKQKINVDGIRKAIEKNGYRSNYILEFKGKQKVAVSPPPFSFPREHTNKG